MFKRSTVVLGVVAVVGSLSMLLAACSSTPAAQPTAAPAPAAPAAQPAAQFPKMDIKLGHPGVLDMSYHKGAVKFSELMKERTGGNVNVQVFPNSQLGSEKDMLEQVKN